MQELTAEERPLATQTRLGPVTVTGIRGRVGETLVYAARHSEGHAVEIREYWPPHSAQRSGGLILIAEPDVATAFEAGLAAFVELGEALRAAGMNRGGARVEAVMRANGTAYWITPKADWTLAEASDGGALPPPLVLAVASRLAQALDEMHSAGLWHLDVAPSTIAVDDRSLTLAYPSTDRRSLMLALQRQDGFTRPPYSPLEAHDGAQRLPLTAETDVYSASVVVWELAYGSPPAPWWSSNQMDPKADGYPAGFTAGLRRGLARLPNERFASITAWREALSLPPITDMAPWFDAPPSQAVDSAPEGSGLAVSELPLIDPFRAEALPSPSASESPPVPTVLPRPRHSLGVNIGLGVVTLVSLTAIGLAIVPGLMATLRYAVDDLLYRDAAPPALAPVTPEPELTIEEPAPAQPTLPKMQEPVLRELTPEPPMQESTPAQRPTVKAPALREPTPEPTTEEPTPAPRAPPKAQTPAVREPAPRPKPPPRPAPKPEAPPPPNRGSAYISSPQWLERPKGALIVRHTPPRALQEGVSGQVIFDCLVRDDGGFESCAFKSETPRGYEFAQLSRGLLGHYRLGPHDRDGNPVAGRRYLLTLNLGVSRQ